MVESHAKDAHGACKKSVVELDHTLAVVCLVLNVFLPGVGTMISACAGKEFNGMALLFGLLQLLTAFIVVGWIWSIVHGVWLLDKSKRH